MKSSTRERQPMWWETRAWKLVGYQGRKIVGEIFPARANESDWVLWIRGGRRRVTVFKTHTLAHLEAEKRLGESVAWVLMRAPRARLK